jgi:glycerophosphoryl diester phosphodiesterase
MIRRNAVLMIVAAFALSVFGLRGADPAPLYRAHAHNDYEHTRPLWDALEHGFTSVEADIHLSDGKLLVGHDRKDLSRQKTLESLYLEPLSKLAKEHGGRIYPGWPTVILLIDIKTEAEPTYSALSAILERYSPMLTRFEGDLVRTNAVTAIITGNRPREQMKEQPVRYAAYDGRLKDLDEPASPAFIPLISDSWSEHFTWKGNGPLAEGDRTRLRDIVSKTHAQKRELRLWAAPDNPNAWNELYRAGVDFLNTDDLSGMERFLRSKK